MAEPAALPSPAAMFDLTGRVALVTGASRGIGLAMARALAGAGARVVMNARDADALEAASEAVRAAGGRAEALPFDVSVPETTGEAVAQIEARHGRFDILISNVGRGLRKPVTELTEAEWTNVLDLSLTAGWRLAMAAAAPMRRAGWGRMIFVSSINGTIVRHDMAAYAAAKAGLEGMVRSLAVELGPDGITANAIAPGYVRTDGNLPLRTQRPEFEGRISGRTALGRWGVPEDIAAPALMLASPASGFITGSTLMVDGGITVKI